MRLDKRNQSVELLRIFSAFGIVAFHGHAGIVGNIGYAGLIVFLFLLAYFESRSSATDLVAPAQRLLLPWLSWCAIFSIYNVLAGHWPLSRGLPIWSSILTGASPHLWFLPFAFVATLLIRTTKRSVNGSAVSLTAAILCVGLMAGKHWWRPWAGSMPSPIPEYMLALVPVLAGISLARDFRIGLTGTIFAVWIGAITALTHHSESSFVYAIGIPVAAAAVMLGRTSLRLPVDVGRLSRYMLGVYLSHPLFLSVGHGIKGLSPLGNSLTAFGLSVAFTWVASGRALGHLLSCRRRSLTLTQR